MCFRERVGEHSVRTPPCAPLLANVGEGTVGPLTPPVPPGEWRSVYVRSISSGDIAFAGMYCIGMKVDIEEAASGI